VENAVLKCVLRSFLNMAGLAAARMSGGTNRYRCGTNIFYSVSVSKTIKPKAP